MPLIEALCALPAKCHIFKQHDHSQLNHNLSRLSHMFSYAHCTTLAEFQDALRGQIGTWNADIKPHEECHKLLFDYIKAVNSRLYPNPGQAAVGHQGVMGRLQDLLYTQSPYSTAEAYQAVHDILFPVSRDFTSAQLMEIVPLAHYILHLRTDARFAPVMVDQELAKLLDNVLGSGSLDGQLEAMYPLTTYTTDPGVFSTGLDMDLHKKENQLLRDACELSIFTYEKEQMKLATQKDEDMQDTQFDPVQIAEAMRLSVEDMKLSD